MRSRNYITHKALHEIAQLYRLWDLIGSPPLKRMLSYYRNGSMYNSVKVIII
jgi:hypothetical protein